MLEREVFPKSYSQEPRKIKTEEWSELESNQRYFQSSQSKMPHNVCYFWNIWGQCFHVAPLFTSVYESIYYRDPISFSLLHIEYVFLCLFESLYQADQIKMRTEISNFKLKAIFRWDFGVDPWVGRWWVYFSNKKKQTEYYDYRNRPRESFGLLTNVS